MSTTAYSVRNDAKLTLRSFSSKKAARSYGNGNQYFASIEELIACRLTEDEMRRVYRNVTGYESKVKDRDYLAELLFNAIVAANIPHTDTEMDFSIQATKEDIVTESAVETTTTETKAPKVARPKKEPRRKFDATSNDPNAAFGVIPGSHRANALKVLHDNIGKSVAIGDIAKAVYGSESNEKSVGAVTLVIKGLMTAATKDGVKFHIEKAGRGKAIEYTLQAK